MQYFMAPWKWRRPFKAGSYGLRAERISLQACLKPIWSTPIMQVKYVTQSRSGI